MVGEIFAHLLPTLLSPQSLSGRRGVASTHEPKNGWSWTALNNNGYDQKNEPTIFCPAEYTTKTKPKTNQKN